MSRAAKTMAAADTRLPEAARVTELFKRIPTSTAHQARLQLYQATRRPQWQERIIETPWGRAIVRGKLGQVHADIVEAICRHAEDHRVVAETGHLQVLVDPYKVRVSVGGGSAYPKDTLWRMLTELREASITLEVPSQRVKVLGGILDRVEASEATRLHPVTGEPRALWRVTFDPAFAALLQADLQLYYEPGALACIDTGVAQAIARHVLTHREQPEGGWHLDTLIRLVGAEGANNATLRNRRREVHACAAQLEHAGVRIEGDRVLKM